LRFRTRVRIGRIHQLLNTGCIEHVDFVSLDDIEFDVDAFEELDIRTAHLKSKTSLRTLPMEDESPQIDEIPYRSMDDHELFSIIAKADPDQLKETAIACAIMMKRYSEKFVVQGETLQSKYIVMVISNSSFFSSNGENLPRRLSTPTLVIGSLLRRLFTQNGYKFGSEHHIVAGTW
jgi:hypothetical protein